MATWVLRNVPWTPLHRARLRLECLGISSRTVALPFAMTFKQYFSTPQVSEETPAMLEMKRQAYPSVPLDTSIFEDSIEDYGEEVHNVVLGGTASAPPARPYELLERLVSQDQYTDASRVLAELSQMGVVIRPHIAYSEAALNVLRGDYDDLHSRCAAFIEWWSLIPAALPSVTISASLKQIESMLVNEPVPDIPLLTSYALTSASKGYASLVDPLIISHIVLYTTPTSSIFFLQAFNEAASIAVTEGEEVTGKSSSARLSMCYSIAIRMQCLSKRLDEALRLLQMARSRNILISKTAYATLADKLHRALDLENLSIVENLRRTQTKFPRETSCLFNSSYVPPALTTSALLYADNSSLAAALRVIRRNLIPSRYPTPSALATFIAAYRDTGRTRALHTIRKRSYTSYPGTSMWALSEMLYHLRRDERSLVLFVFGQHFHLVGVPKSIRKSHWRTHKRLYREKHLIPEAFKQLLWPLHPLKELLWPSTHHTALVWRIVVQNTVGLQALEDLYQELLEQIASARNAVPMVQTPNSQFRGQSTSSDTSGSSEPYPEPLTPPFLFDSAHFNSFIRAFAITEGPERATQVITDMYRLGITPGLESLTILASAYARDGHIDKLTALFDRMEKPSPDHSTPKSETATQSMPIPTAVMYTAVIRHLLLTRRYRDAVTIARRMRTRVRYVLGSDPLTDAVLADLARCIKHGMGVNVS